MAIDRNTAPFYIIANNASTYVKEGNFFREQGGLTADWGKHWVAVEASSLTEARNIAVKLRRERFPYAHKTMYQDGTLEILPRESSQVSAHTRARVDAALDAIAARAPEQVKKILDESP